MLDERGVEWGNVRDDGSESDYLTEWQFEDNQGKAIATEWAVGSGLSVEIHRYHLTPEQAIAATLGCGTCHLTSAPQYGEGCQECSSCGAVLDGYLFDGGHCPNCRAKVVDE
jgi:hypothetical protein